MQTSNETEAHPMPLCETCEAGHWERAWFTGTPIFVHADGTREVYYECDCGESDD